MLIDFTSLAADHLDLLTSQIMILQTCSTELSFKRSWSDYFTEDFYSDFEFRIAGQLSLLRFRISRGFTWQCKDCRNCGKSNTKLSISNSKEIKDLKESICDEIKEKLPVLVKDALIETSKCTGFFTKTFAEVVKQQNETVIKNAVKSTSEQLLRKV